MTTAISDAYDRAAPAWRAGAEPLYACLARTLFAHAPLPLEGSRVLDVGAGSGVAGAAARAAGATRAVAVDLAPSMLDGQPDAVAADLRRLPFAADTFDLAVASFVVGHLTEPVPALAELRRVAPRLLASAFVEGWSHPAKSVVEDVLAQHGYRAPDWYEQFKTGSERQVGDPVRLGGMAEAAGHRNVTVAQVEVATGISRPDELVAWRLGMAHHAPFVATLDRTTQDVVRREAEERLVGAPPVVVPMLVLTAR